MATPASIHISPNWRLAVAIAVLGHLALGAVIIVQRSSAAPSLPEPVMVVELPQGAAPSASLQDNQEVQPQLQPLPQMVAPQLDIPKVDAPLPPDPVLAPTPRPLPRTIPTRVPQARPAEIPAATPPRTSTASAPVTGAGNAGDGPSDDPRAEQAQADWYSLVSAHLERNKRYPREARRDGLQGTPMVRFTVDRRGRVTAVSIRESSGHLSLDEATLSLMRHVSPLPPMPRSMSRDSVTISLPIEYSLSRK